VRVVTTSDPSPPRPDDGPAEEVLFALAGVRQARGATVVLDGVDLALPAGVLCALIGPSGAGKTSLLRLLNRLDDPTGGTVTYRGRPLSAFDVRALRREIGFVFQRPTMFPGTVGANLRVALELASDTPRAAPRAASPGIEAALEMVELPRATASRDAEELSGGEQQRVSIARALMTSPRVLLLDEPTSALDPEVAERLLATVVRLSRDAGLSVIMVTHRLSEASDSSTFTVMLEAGRVVEAGPTERMFREPSHERTRAYLATARAR
jgi:ABC-type methionine transport system ATPase subunit